jgi:hypothetical protein
MKKIESRRRFRGFLPALIVIGALAASSELAGFAQESASEGGSSSQPAGQRTDGQVEMDVVHALDAQPSLQQDWITAGTVQGEVTLSGTCASEANKKLAESTAAKVPGVVKVVDNLKVGDPQSAANGQGQPQDQVPYTDDSGAQPSADASNGAQPQPGYEPNQPQYNQPQYNQPQYNQPQYPAQPNAPPPGYPAQGGNAYPAQPQRAQVPSGPVTIPEGTLLRVRSSEPLLSKRAKDGTPVEFTVYRDVYAGGVLAIPRGATIRGEVVNVKNSGALSGSPELGLEIENLDLGGNTYALSADPYNVRGPNKVGRTAGNAIGGAILGALIGGAVGGGGGAAIGAGAGAVGGTAASAATPGPQVWIPAEALMDFHLNAPLTVQPVSMQEAQRLAQNAPPPSQRPTLYRRRYYPGPYGYPPPPPPGYYYRPY